MLAKRRYISKHVNTIALGPLWYTEADSESPLILKYIMASTSDPSERCHAARTPSPHGSPSSYSRWPPSREGQVDIQVGVIFGAAHVLIWPFTAQDLRCQGVYGEESSRDHEDTFLLTDPGLTEENRTVFPGTLG